MDKVAFIFYVIDVIFCSFEIGFAAKNLSEKRYFQFGYSLTLAIILAVNLIKLLFLQ